MSFKTTYWLFGILVLLVAIVGVALYLDPVPVDLGPYVFPELNDPRAAVKFSTDKVGAVALERREAAEKLVLERDEKLDLWRMKEPVATEADARNTSDLISKVVEAKRDTKADPGNPATLGLDPPRAVLTLGLTDGRSINLDVGDSTFGAREAVVYLRSPQRSQVCVVRKDDVKPLLDPFVAYRSRYPLASAPRDVLAVKLAHTVEGKAKEAPVELVKDTGQDRWRYTQPFQGDANNRSTDTKVDPGQPPTNVEALRSLITALAVEYTDEKKNDFIANNVSDWQKYGLQEGGDLLTVEIQRAEKYHSEANLDDKTRKENAPPSTQTLVIAVGKKVDGQEKYYARRKSENNVIAVPAGPVSSLLELLRKPDAVRERRLLTLDSTTRIPNVIFLKSKAGEMEFYRRADDKPWQIYYGGSATPTNADENVVKGLLNLLGQDNMIEGFPDMSKTTEAELGLDKPTLEASFWVLGIAPDEKKDDKPTDDKKEPEKKDEKQPDPNARPKLKDPANPTAKLIFGKRNPDRKTVYVKRVVPDEKPGYFEVRDVLYERLGDGPLVFLDRKLPGFRDGAFNATENVTRVRFTYKGKTTEISRPGTTDKDAWKLAQPQELAGRAVDSSSVFSLLGPLNRLTALKFVAQKPTEQQLKTEYGFDNPTAKAEITVTKDGKDSTYEIVFGKETEADALFARFGGAYNSDLVFTVARSALNTFGTELLDRTVFDFDPAKVQEIHLRGWSGSAGVTLGLELARQDDSTWTVKTPPGADPYHLDSSKVNNFLATLAHLRADRFVAHAKPVPDPAHELDVKLGGLMIKLKLKDAEKPERTLLLGKAEGNGYYATANTLPGDVFIVDKAFFENAKSSVAFLAKK